jgi:hypothetical protein
MNNITIDFTTIPAKATCSKCGKETDILPQKKLSDTMKVIASVEDAHKNCK